MGRFQSAKIWDYIAMNAKNQIERGGWYNSFNGEPFSKEEMKQYIDNTYEKLKPYLKPNDKNGIAVEIGCASGLTLFRMAPFFKKYIATDMAAVNLKLIKETVIEKNIENIELAKCKADEIYSLLYEQDHEKWIKCMAVEHSESDLKFDGADMVIMNSVCQYFPDNDYLDDVILQGIKLLKSGGIFYIGDVLDKGRLDAFKSELLEYQSKFPDKKVNIKREGEIWIERDYFYRYLKLDMVNGVAISDKIFNVENELTKYRFDVVIEKK